jgi:putative ABC transport system substrate-binding protein
MDLATVDKLLTTPRSVRARLDLKRPVPPELIEECLEIAVQAPQGSNLCRYQFIVVTDATKRKVLGDLYRKAFVTVSAELIGKQLAMLKEVVPKVSRMALLGNPDKPGNAQWVRHAQDAARALGVRLQALEARDPGEIDNAFTEMTTEQAGAVVILNDTMLFDNRGRIADHAARRRLPTGFGLSEYAEAGGLLAYEPRRSDRWRRAATYVDKILKGAKPADLPVEHPTKFELLINLKTAKVLGLTIPPSLLARADQLLE